MKIFRIITNDGLVLTIQAIGLHTAINECKEAGYTPVRVIQLD